LIKNKYKFLKILFKILIFKTFLLTGIVFIKKLIILEVGKSYCFQVEQPDDLILPVDFDSYVGTKRYVSVKNFNLKSGASVKDLEINSIQDCNIKNKKVLYN
jgi:hypothetical protein